MRPFDRQPDPLRGWLWGIAITLTLIVIAGAAFAQTTSVAGKRLANGDALLVAAVQEPPTDGSSATIMVCFRVQGGAELGCAPRSAFVAIGNNAFTVGGELQTISETLPAGELANVNLVAFLRTPLPGGGSVIVRTVDADGDATERAEPIVFGAVDLAPKAPVLLLLDELQSALDRVREQLASN